MSGRLGACVRRPVRSCAHRKAYGFYQIQGRVKSTEAWAEDRKQGTERKIFPTGKWLLGTIGDIGDLQGALRSSKGTDEDE